MFKFIRIFLLCVLILAAVTAAAVASGYPVGMYLEPKLEGVLTRLFGMEVTIDGLRANPFNGNCSAARIRFMNQPEFSKGPHLDTAADFQIDYMKLKQKHVLIPKIYLKDPYYLIETIPDAQEGSRSNIRTWIRHIKDRNKNKKKDEEKEKAEPKPPSKKWKVTLPEINIENGTFIFHARGETETKRKFVFQKLEGTLWGFEWPSRGPETFDQKVDVHGMFGEKNPAPIKAKGEANFATSQVGFNLVGDLKGGDLTEYKFLWQGLPVWIEGGFVDLEAKLLCSNRELQSISQLVLRELNAAPRKSASGLVWGIPAIGMVRFLESQKQIDLRVEVNGNIADPKFGFPKAFRTAFQSALMTKTSAGLKIFSDPVISAAQKAGATVWETPGKVVKQIEKLKK